MIELSIEPTWLPAESCLRETERSAHRAERIRRRVLLDVIFRSNAVFLARHVIDIGNALIHVRSSVRPLRNAS